MCYGGGGGRRRAKARTSRRADEQTDRRADDEQMSRREVDEPRGEEGLERKCDNNNNKEKFIVEGWKTMFVTFTSSGSHPLATCIDSQIRAGCTHVLKMKQPHIH